MYLWSSQLSSSLLYRIVPKLNGTYSLVPTCSDSVVLLVFNFCFLERQWIIPHPIDIAPPVWLQIFGYTTNYAPTQVNNSFKLKHPMIHLYSLLCFKNVMQHFIFFQPSTLLFATRFVKYTTSGFMSGPIRFVTYNSFSNTEWNIFALYISILSIF